MRKITLVLGLLLSACMSQAQVTLAIATSDNCMAPTPNSGTYTQSGTLNGKPMYVKGANLRIVWDGTQWVIQGDDPAIGGVTWVTGWVNPKNTATPPTDCWTSPAGCFQATLSGPSAFSIVNSAASPTLTIASSNATTVTYTVTFSGTINGLTASNFALTTSGAVTGASITSVTQTATPSVYTVVVNFGTGNGTVRLDLANDTGASATVGCTPAFPVTGQVFSTYVAPVTLTAGDIAFTGYNSSSSATVPDDFTFIVLKNGGLPVGTKLFFTDNGFNNLTAALTTTEGTIFYDVTTAIPQFTQVKITFPLSGSVYTASTGTATLIGTAAMSLSTAGDQVIAYQGKMNTPTFISAIHMNAEVTGATNLGSLTNWDDFINGTSAARSYIPTGLTNGTNAVMVVNGTAAPYTEFDNAIYNCTGSSAATVAAMRTSINDRANWNKQDTTVFTTPPVCTFLGTTNVALENKISIFPNPTNAILNINLVDVQNAKIVLFDLHGRKLISQSMSNSLKLDISHLSKGMYILQVETEAGQLTKQIVKE